MVAKATLSALEHAWRTIEPLGNTLAVMGGLAVVSYSRIRTTHDVDLLIGVESDGFQRIVDAVAQAGFRPKRKEPLITIGTLCGRRLDPGGDLGRHPRTGPRSEQLGREGSGDDRLRLRDELDALAEVPR